MNIFEVLGVASREDVNTNMLVFAFNNSARFQKHLLNKIDPTLNNPETLWRAYPRVALAGIGVPDIVMVGKQESVGYLVLIENKLTADEGEEQTSRYASKDCIDALAGRFLPNISDIRQNFIFLTLFPDISAGNNSFKPLTHRELFDDFPLDNNDKLHEHLIADWKAIITPFYARDKFDAQANVFMMLQDTGGLDAGYLYFREIMQQINLPNGLWIEDCWRDSREGRKYYGARFSKEEWQTSELYVQNNKWQFDGINHDIHIEPQYNVLNGRLSIFLHYETCPYKPEKWARENICQEDLNRYLEHRNSFVDLLKNKNVAKWEIGGGWNQIGKLTADFSELMSQQAMDVLVDAFSAISEAVDQVNVEKKGFYL